MAKRAKRARAQKGKMAEGQDGKKRETGKKGKSTQTIISPRQLNENNWGKGRSPYFICIPTIQVMLHI